MDQKRINMSVHIKLDQDLVDKVERIVKAKNPLRKIKTSAKAVNEALITFVKANKKFLDQKSDQEDPSHNLNSSKVSQEGQ